MTQVMVFLILSIHPECCKEVRHSTRGCGYHWTGRNPTVQSEVMKWQRTNSEPRAQEPQLAEQATEESPSGAHNRCRTIDRRIAGKTLETENAPKGEQPEKWCMSPRAADYDADGGKDSGGALPQIVERQAPVPQVMVQEVVREAD